ncbi:MAG: ABC transporter permease [Acidimicrobiales bacterium]
MNPSVRRFLKMASPLKVSAIYLWVIFGVLFGIMEGKNYLSVSSGQIVFSEGAVTAVLALAFLVPLTTDTFDLSIGEMMSLSVVIMCWMGKNTHVPIPVVCLGLVVLGGLFGAVSGFIVVKLKVNSLIATLGMSQVIMAIALLWSRNSTIYSVFSPAVLSWGNRTFFKVPVLDIYLLVFATIIWFVLEQTPLGRRMFATGGNPEAARLVGIRTNKIVWGSLVASGMIAACAGIMYTLQIGSYTSDVGSGYLFPALTAVFFGASQLSQRPNVWGTVIAYFCLAWGIQGLDLRFGVQTYWVSPMFEGLALVIAVAIASWRGSVGGGRDSKFLRRFGQKKELAAVEAGDELSEEEG